MKSNKRLYPTIFSTRYFPLSKLRDKTLQLIDKVTVGAGREKSVLIDFGCGNMPYKEKIDPKVGQYLGVDLAINPVADHFIDYDSKTSLPNQVADIILSNQVLEHVDSPDGYLQEAWRILKPGGSMIISTHGYWLYHPTPNDYWRWTSAGLRKTIENANFEVMEFYGIMGLAASGIQLFQDSIINKLPKFLIPPIALVMQFMVRVFDKLHTQKQRDRDAAIYVILAVRPAKG
ncbi:2-polyprenyl-3-methyl-5-hydroxy-6-metoxy-1,4-benzoquinol methylase [bacterium A37T11]|nr:2-polyprenyl-3-methyl-5-hydroxy-6-metoxy-1,4-benzoquinol methylase [bacterium A37T11]